MTFILDTNIVTALIKEDAVVLTQIEKHREAGIYLCQPVYYEVMRGLIWKNAARKIALLEKLRATFGWFQLTDEDWQLASQL